MKTFKLLLADAKCCAQFDSILRSIVDFTEQAALSLCSVVGICPQFAQVVVIVKSAEQTALAMCSLVRVPLP